MKREAAVIVGVALAVAYLAGLGSSAIEFHGNEPSTTGFTSTSTTTDSSVSTLCTIPAEGEVVLQVVNSDSGMPLPYTQVQARFLAPVCLPNPHTTSTLSPATTNGTGYVTFGGEVGQYYLGVDNYSYWVVVPALPGRQTCVTLAIPSGETHITYSQFLAGC